MSETIEVTDHPGQSVPVPINKPWDAPTIVTDGVMGASSNGHVIKIQLVEHFPTEQEICARHILNLSMQLEQFLKFVAAMNEIAAGVAAPEAEAPK